VSRFPRRESSFAARETSRVSGSFAFLGHQPRSCFPHLVFGVVWASSSLSVLFRGQSRANKFAHATHNEP